jgi:hypothetical protein
MIQEIVIDNLKVKIFETRTRMGADMAKKVMKKLNFYYPGKIA